LYLVAVRGRRRGGLRERLLERVRRGLRERFRDEVNADVDGPVVELGLLPPPRTTTPTPLPPPPLRSLSRLRSRSLKMRIFNVMTRAIILQRKVNTLRPWKSFLLTCFCSIHPLRHRLRPDRPSVSCHSSRCFRHHRRRRHRLFLTATKRQNPCHHRRHRRRHLLLLLLRDPCDASGSWNNKRQYIYNEFIYTLASSSITYYWRFRHRALPAFSWSHFATSGLLLRHHRLRRDRGPCFRRPRSRHFSGPADAAASAVAEVVAAEGVRAERPPRHPLLMAR
jgi:hypothetical protein